MRLAARHLASHPLTSHVARASLWAGAFVGLSTCAPSPVTMAALVAVSAALYFSLFALFHDAAHGALGLARTVNEALLALLSAPLFMSTHAQRQLHLRHHARPLAVDDVEGIGATLSFARALVASPFLVGHNIVGGLRAVPAKLVRLVALEWIVCVVFAALAIARPGSSIALFVLVAVTLQMSTCLWASHIPHNPPRLVEAIARKLVMFRSPVVLSLLFHREHHDHPRAPCARLAHLAHLTHVAHFRSAAIASASAATVLATTSPDVGMPSHQ